MEALARLEIWRGLELPGGWAGGDSAGMRASEVCGEVMS